MATWFSRKRKDGSLAWYTKEPDDKGGWRQVLLPGVTSETQAKRRALAMEHERNQQAEGVERGKLFAGTVADLCEWAWDNSWKRLHGRKAIRSRIRCYLGEGTPLGALDVRKLSAEAVNQYLIDLSTKPSRLGTPYSATTLEMIRLQLHRAYVLAQEAKRWGPVNPVATSTPWEAASETPASLTLDEAVRTIHAAPPHYRGMFAIGILAGLRKGEIFGMLKRDVDADARQLLVQRSHERLGTKGSNKPEAVPIHDALWPFIEEALATPGPYLFSDPKGERILPTRKIEMVWRAAQRRAGVCSHWQHKCRRKGCGHVEIAGDGEPRRCPSCDFKLWPSGVAKVRKFHGARHTTAVLALKAGASIASVQRILRHQDPRLTIRTYGHLDNQHLTDELNRIPLAMATESGPEPAPPIAATGSEPPAQLRNGASPGPRGRGAPMVHGVPRKGFSGEADSRPSMKKAGFVGGAEGDRTPDLCIANGHPAPRSTRQRSQALVNTDTAEGAPGHGEQPFATVSTPRGASMVREGAPAVVHGRNAQAGGSLLRSLADGSLEHGWLTVPQVAERLQLSRDFVYRQVTAGALEAVRVGAAIRISPEALAAYLGGRPGLCPVPTPALPPVAEAAEAEAAS